MKRKMLNSKKISTKNHCTTSQAIEVKETQSKQLPDLNYFLTLPLFRTLFVPNRYQGINDGSFLAMTGYLDKFMEQNFYGNCCTRIWKIIFKSIITS